ncbi:uncharacterized protein LOC131597968 [Vicia villosa]|uniref:uncharacterized protein LOC131597968 n=1 Tax=Vicia villosa TaxID=3911 RepID=UPI00273B60F6|nr:uncharacterized protein LOC131597968 [Vicia villosa]
MVAGRNNDAIVEALTMLAGAIGQVPQANAGNGEEIEFRALGDFIRNKPPTFEGEHEPDKKVQFGTYMLEKEDEVGGITLCKYLMKKDWKLLGLFFRDAFLENHFLEDVRGKKEVEFLELKQGNGTVVVYAERFQELIKYCPHYNTINAERSNCLKFVNGFRPDIKKAIGYKQITHFAELVNKSRIYDEDSRESSSYYKSLNDRKGKGKFFGKPCDEKKKQSGFRKKPSGGIAYTSIKCFKCGVEGHGVMDCLKVEVTCFKCGKANLRSMVIDTPVMGYVSTSFLCFNCPLSIFGREFGNDLICLPLEQIDVILCMNWLEFNRVYTNCVDKAVIFPETGVKEDVFLSARTIEELTIVRDFVEVFPEDVRDLLPEREVEFTIDLVPGTSPVSMALYG